MEPVTHDFCYCKNHVLQAPLSSSELTLVMYDAHYLFKKILIAVPNSDIARSCQPLM